ncbi:hypothetical protein [Haloarcula marismortui]|jgi:hypothetical protein|uniref:Uncharacterized protein n=1 Tax=Haloarcula marismortui ATCC 33799 TaxID=662475 RepID=M0KSS6_9EURY|nr:hypothetical protein [Haloarcula californiae]EMA23958.1 hypothetical protein C435_03528 [Haloarcula californiae ATCC 33799]
MKDERRRDRVWKYILNQLRQHEKVTLDEIDVALTTRVDDYPTAQQLVNEENYRSEDNISEDAGGEGYNVEVEPDASRATKRHVLKTMSGDRFRLTKPVEGEESVWTSDKHLEYLYGQRSETPLEHPITDTYTASWENVEDFKMDIERRRDRLWFNVLNLLKHRDRIETKDISTSVTVVTESRATAFRLIEQEAYRETDDMTTTDDGEFVVSVEPDVSLSTKLSLLRTLAKDRYDFLTDAGKFDGWTPGPWGCALFDLTPQTEDIPPQTAQELTQQLMANPDVDHSERVERINGLLRTDS